MFFLQLTFQLLFVSSTLIQTVKVLPAPTCEILPTWPPLRGHGRFCSAGQQSGQCRFLVASTLTNSTELPNCSTAKFQYCSSNSAALPQCCPVTHSVSAQYYYCKSSLLLQSSSSNNDMLPEFCVKLSGADFASLAAASLARIRRTFDSVTGYHPEILLDVAETIPIRVLIPKSPPFPFIHNLCIGSSEKLLHNQYVLLRDQLRNHVKVTVCRGTVIIGHTSDGDSQFIYFRGYTAVMAQ